MQRYACDSLAAAISSFIAAAVAATSLQQHRLYDFATLLQKTHTCLPTSQHFAIPQREAPPFVQPSSTTATLPKSIGTQRHSSAQASTIESNETAYTSRHSSFMAVNKVLENGVLAWIPAGSKGVRINGWENKIANIPEDQTSDYATTSIPEPMLELKGLQPS
jgi:hypothetical protein